MSDILYGLYDCERRSYYADDGGGSSSGERLCFVHSDPEYIRSTMNALWAHEDLFEGKTRTQMRFDEGATKSNRWASDGGGCMASGHYEIRAMIKESAAAYIASQQEIIDRGNKQRADLAEQNRKYEEERARRKKADEEYAAKIAKIRERNEKRRKHRAENKEEVNAKQRAYRKKARAEKAAKELTEKERHQKFLDAYDAWRKRHDWDEMPESVYMKLYYKHYPEKKPK